MIADETREEITEMQGGEKEAQRYVWDGAIPLQVHLHDSEVTTLPPPPPALVLSTHYSSSIS